MQPTIISVALFVVVVTYCVLSWRERNWFNVLTPFALFSIPSLYLLELIYGHFFGYVGSIFSYIYCYSAYSLGAVFTAVAYVATPARVYPIFIRLPRIYIPGLPYVLLVFAMGLYAPIVLKYPDLILSPRRIYEVTRTGFGLQFFLSAFAVYFGLILLLFSSAKKRRMPIFIYSFFALGVLYLHGSKSQIVIYFLILLYFAVFVARIVFGAKQILCIAAAAMLLITALFFASRNDSDGAALLVGIADYAEYTRNAAAIIDDRTLTPQFGRILFESKVYVLVPRIFFPDKPRDYGPFWLAKRYFPDRFELNAGAPDFGIGTLYADFGIFAIVYHLFASLTSGLILKLLVTRLRYNADAGTFLLLLVLLDVALIPTGAGGIPMFLYWLLAHIAKSLGSSSSEATNHNMGRACAA